MKISIVTICYNSEKTIEATIKSVLEQKYENYEHIFIDGASKDKTLEIIHKYEPIYSGKIKIISEPDNGLYDAMNKGIKLATGDVIGILNSDDCYADENVLESIANEFINTNCDGTYSDLVFMDNETLTIKKRFMSGKTGNIYLGWHPPHPALYLKKEIYQKKGLYRTDFKISSDYALMIKIICDKDIKLNYINRTLIHMRMGGVSTNGLKNYYQSVKEANIGLKEAGIKFPFIVSFCRIIRVVLQTIFK